MRWAGKSAGGVLFATLALAASAQAVPVQGDFDGDGRDDLASGAIGQQVGGTKFAGSVHVIYGGPNGLSGRDRIFTQNTPKVKEKAETGDEFGGSLAAGDFDADGFDDLAVSAWTETRGVFDNVGVVHILYGSHRGLTGKGSQLLEPGRGGIRPKPDQADFFGWALAAGNFGKGRPTDLVIQTSGFKVDGVDRAGAVNVLYGSRRGLRRRGAQLFSQATPGIPDVPEFNDVFGWSLAVGDLGHNRRDDLAIGVPLDKAQGEDDAGLVHVLYGGRRGLRVKGNQVVIQGPPDDDGGGQPEAGDFFGWTLAAGDFGDGKRADLAVGAPGETLMEGEVGAVSVVYGSRRGLRLEGFHQFIEQPASVEGGGPESGDSFGRTLAAANVGITKQADLIVGSPFEAVAGFGNQTGGVDVIYGDEQGLGMDGNAPQFFSQGTPGMQNTPSTGDEFGRALALGRFDGKGPADLAVAIPFEDLAPTAGRAHRGSPVASDTGAVAILLGTSTGLTVDGNRFLFEGGGGLAGAAQANDLFGSALSGPAAGVPLD
jgi:hypothetical protein